MTLHLICDLDDSLIKTDCLFEQWIQLLKVNPLKFIQSFFWFFKGRAYFKAQLAQCTEFDASDLPYRESVIEFIKEFKNSQNCKVILASASPEPWVSSVAKHLQLFDHVLASNSQSNLKGEQKLKAIQGLLGDSPWSYIGDSEADLPIWRQSAQIIAVNPSSSLIHQIKHLNKPTHYLTDHRRTTGALILKQIRIHQWAKNALIFLPLLAAHQFNSIGKLSNGLLAFLSFSFCASLIYLLNDLLDLESDRKHKTKRTRPFASGHLSLRWAFLLIPLLALGVISCSRLLSVEFTLWLSLYFVSNLLYSFKLKKIVILDIVLLSMMYSIRVFAGSAATEVLTSEWLMSFSIMFFFGLACIKRYSEIHKASSDKISGRGYISSDASAIQSLGVGASLLSVLIFTLYLQSPEVRALYSRPELLWGVNPLLLYWVSRVWLLTNRDQMNDDPVVFALKDRTSWFCLVLIIMLGRLAI